MPTESQISARKLTAAQLEEQATAMRLAGMSCPEIAKQLGKHTTTVWRAIKRAKERSQKLASDTWEEMRQLESERLDHREVRINTLIQEASTTKTDDGKIVKVRADPHVIARLDTRLDAISAARRKLWGLDAPNKTDLTTDGGPLEIVLRPRNAMGDSD